MTREEFSGRVEKMIPLLYRVCVTQLREPSDREDVVQTTLEKAWLKCDTLRDEKYFETWVVRILLNECHDLQRKQARESDGEVPEVPVEDVHDDLRAALCSLENKWRVPILLHYIEGYGMREIARMLSVSIGTVQSRLLRGRRKLKKMLTEEGE